MKYKSNTIEIEIEIHKHLLTTYFTRFLFFLSFIYFHTHTFGCKKGKIVFKEHKLCGKCVFYFNSNIKRNENEKNQAKNENDFWRLRFVVCFRGTGC